MPTWGWRVAFLIGALPAFYVFILRRSLPESPRFLASQGRYPEAEAIVRQVARESGAVTSAAEPPPAAPASPARVRVAELFSTRYLNRTVVLWVLWATMNFSYYGIFLWLPLQFVRKGFSLNDALLFNLIIAVAQIPGYFSAAYFVEHMGRKLTLIVYLVGAAVGAFFFGQVALVGKDVASILISGSVISFFNLGAWGVVYTYTPELYPTRLRGTGPGWAAATGRLFAFLAPASIAYQIAVFVGDQTVFLVFTAVMVLGGLVVQALGLETRGSPIGGVGGLTRAWLLDGEIEFILFIGSPVLSARRSSSHPLLSGPTTMQLRCDPVLGSARRSRQCRCSRASCVTACRGSIG